MTKKSFVVLDFFLPKENGIQVQHRNTCHLGHLLGQLFHPQKKVISIAVEEAQVHCTFADSFYGMKVFF